MTWIWYGYSFFMFGVSRLLKHKFLWLKCNFDPSIFKIVNFWYSIFLKSSFWSL